MSRYKSKMLMNYPFPGNIRELENCIERSLILDPHIISESNLPKQMLVSKVACLSTDIEILEEGMQLEPLLEDLEKKYLLKVLERTGGAKKKAGELLGMSFRSIRYRLAKFGVIGGMSEIGELLFPCEFMVSNRMAYSLLSKSDDSVKSSMKDRDIEMENARK